jgi:hypothetical protein
MTSSEFFCACVLSSSNLLYEPPFPSESSFVMRLFIDHCTSTLFRLPSCGRIVDIVATRGRVFRLIGILFGQRDKGGDCRVDARVYRDGDRIGAVVRERMDVVVTCNRSWVLDGQCLGKQK